MSPEEERAGMLQGFASLVRDFRRPQLKVTLVDYTGYECVDEAVEAVLDLLFPSKTEEMTNRTL